MAGKTSPLAPAVISVVIAESRPYVSAGLRRLLSDQQSVDVIAELTAIQAPPPRPAATPPDVLLLNHALGDDLSETLRRARALFPSSAIVLYGIPSADNGAITALRLGVRGLVDEDAGLGDLVSAVHTVASGGVIITPRLASNLADIESESIVGWSAVAGEVPRLTDRERDVLRLVAHGLTNRRIAAAFGLSEHTVRSHLREVMRKLKARSRIEAVSLGIRLGLIHPADQELLPINPAQ
jgi:DNA-binding NarL/FixJ family response regulator